MRRWLLAAMPSLLLAVTPAACTSAPPSSPPPGAVTATLRDFKVTLGAASIPAGPTTFVLHSRGPSTHEFKFVRTDLPPAGLPLGADGLTVDEDPRQLPDVTWLAGVDIGQTLTIHVTLPPGHYVFFCNYEGHYLGGMYAGLGVDASTG